MFKTSATSAAWAWFSLGGLGYGGMSLAPRASVACRLQCPSFGVCDDSGGVAQGGADPNPNAQLCLALVARGYRRHITRHDASWVRHEPPRPSFAWPSFCFTKNQQVLWKWVAQVRRLFVSMFNRGGHGRIGFRSWPELAGPGPLSAMTKPQSLSRGGWGFIGDHVGGGLAGQNSTPVLPELLAFPVGSSPFP